METNHKDASKQTMGSSFWEDLWPQLLEENKCHIESKSVAFYVPRQPFSALHFHSYLAEAGYPDYVLPHDMRCCEAAKRQEAAEEEAQLAANAETKARQDAASVDTERCSSHPAIQSVDKMVNQLRAEQERRQKLAYEFANRKYPWTMQTPKHELSFEVTTEQRVCFVQPMEKKILDDLLDHECKLMIIDVGKDVELKDCQRWIKFRPYIQMLALVRTAQMERCLQLLGVLHTLVVEESAGNSWHDELEASLRSGLKQAKRLHILRACGEPFLFVFSRFRGICTCDTYGVLRRL
ncbi:uncharacterized protein LOC117589828 [Drosophila guanche]|uniref:Uncharacterized protein n=1 Tax=Drosophila guanche TaxID=7266 RepID=A0A3B0K1G0_DROGU|nr:uncharacterized protein LOC117589828 [Drosophila guanche]SPP88074.1 Hypothetical predicted protein [Drosophila guanche]